jgi:hypothetical protein
MLLPLLYLSENIGGRSGYPKSRQRGEAFAEISLNKLEQIT